MLQMMIFFQWKLNLVIQLLELSSYVLYMSQTRIKGPRIWRNFFDPRTDWNPLFGSQRDSLKIYFFFFQCQIFVLEPSKVAWQLKMQFKVIFQHISTSYRAFIFCCSTHVIVIKFSIFSKKNKFEIFFSKNFILWAGHRKT